MEKSKDAFRTISEVAEWLDVPTHVLRFWESRFTQVKPVKRAGGRRYYRPSDMALLGGIKRLLHDDGLTIRGVQKLLREQGVRHVAALSPAIDGSDSEAGADAGADSPPDRWPFNCEAETQEAVVADRTVTPFPGARSPRPREDDDSMPAAAPAPGDADRIAAQDEPVLSEAELPAPEVELSEPEPQDAPEADDEAAAQPEPALPESEDESARDDTLAADETEPDDSLADDAEVDSPEEPVAASETDAGDSRSDDAEADAPEEPPQAAPLPADAFRADVPEHDPADTADDIGGPRLHDAIRLARRADRARLAARAADLHPILERLEYLHFRGADRPGR